MRSDMGGGEEEEEGRRGRKSCDREREGGLNTGRHGDEAVTMEIMDRITLGCAGSFISSRGRERERQRERQRETERERKRERGGE